MLQRLEWLGENELNNVLQGFDLEAVSQWKEEQWELIDNRMREVNFVGGISKRKQVHKKYLSFRQEKARNSRKRQKKGESKVPLVPGHPAQAQKTLKVQQLPTQKSESSGIDLSESKFSEFSDFSLK